MDVPDQLAEEICAKQRASRDRRRIYISSSGAWQTENHVAQQICDYLRLHGWRVHRLEADLRGPKALVKREEVGTPDYIAVRQREPFGPCHCWYIEVKRPGGKLRKSQEIWIADARRRGWNVAVASSIEDLILAGMPGIEWDSFYRRACDR